MLIFTLCMIILLTILLLFFVCAIWYTFLPDALFFDDNGDAIICTVLRAYKGMYMYEEPRPMFFMHDSEIVKIDPLDTHTYGVYCADGTYYILARGDYVVACEPAAFT